MPPITRLPPLTALRVLEAIRIAGSVTGAARHLNLSHSAVSHQVSALDSWSSTPLFIRRGRRTELTQAGQGLAETTQQAFDSIRHEVDRLPIRGLQVVSLGAIPMVAQLWLPSVLPDLVHDLPHISVHLGFALFDRPARLPPNLIISFAHRDRVNHRDRLLFSGQAGPVCAPSLLAEYNNDPVRVLQEARKIHDEDSRLWRSWQDAASFPLEERSEPLRVSIEESSLIRAAAIAGAGAAICRLDLVRRDIAAGNLVQLSDVTIDRSFFYFLREAPTLRGHPDVDRLADWLVARAKKDRRSERNLKEQTD